MITNAFTKEKAAQWTENIWVRLGIDEFDKATWTRERVHMPWHKREPVSTFSPKVTSPRLSRILIDKPSSTGMGRDV